MSLGRGGREDRTNLALQRFVGAQVMPTRTIGLPFPVHIRAHLPAPCSYLHEYAARKKFSIDFEGAADSALHGGHLSYIQIAIAVREYRTSLASVK